MAFRASARLRCCAIACTAGLIAGAATASEVLLSDWLPSFQGASATTNDHSASFTVYSLEGTVAAVTSPQRMRLGPSRSLSFDWVFDRTPGLGAFFFGFFADFGWYSCAIPFASNRAGSARLNTQRPKISGLAAV